MLDILEFWQICRILHTRIRGLKVLQFHCQFFFFFFFGGGGGGDNRRDASVVLRLYLKKICDLSSEYKYCTPFVSTNVRKSVF